MKPLSPEAARILKAIDKTRVKFENNEEASISDPVDEKDMARLLCEIDEQVNNISACTLEPDKDLKDFFKKVDQEGKKLCQQSAYHHEVGQQTSIVRDALRLFIESAVNKERAEKYALRLIPLLKSCLDDPYKIAAVLQGMTDAIQMIDSRNATGKAEIEDAFSNKQLINLIASMELDEELPRSIAKEVIRELEKLPVATKVT